MIKGKRLCPMWLSLQVLKKALTERWFGEAQLVTEVRPLEGALWSAAEKQHQEYYENNPETDYCMFVVNPKLRLVRQRYTYLLQGSPELHAV